MDQESKDKEGETAATNKSPSLKRKTLLGLGALLAAGVGVYALSKAGSAPEDKAILAVSSLDEGLSSLRVEQAVSPLTYSDGKVDVIFAGAPECSYCQKFVKNDLAEMVKEAEDAGLDFVYRPMAMSAYGVSIATITSCARPNSTVPAVGFLREEYDFIHSLDDALSKAQIADARGDLEQGIEDFMMGVFSKLHDKSAPSVAFDPNCYMEANGDIAKDMDDFSTRFELEGTPSFYYYGTDGGIYRATGSLDLSKAHKAP